MSKSLNFNNVKKRYLSVTLADENNTTLLIGTPTKALMDDLTSLQDNLETIGDDVDNIEALDDLFASCARIMSRNKGGIKITKEFLEDIFDYEDIMIFFNAYIDFVSELANSKN